MGTEMNSKMSYLLSLFKADLIGMTDFHTFPDNIREIVILDGHTSLHAEKIYLLSPGYEKKELRRLVIFPGTVLIAAEPEAENASWSWEERDYIGLSVRLRFPEIYNRLQEMLNPYQRWKEILFQVRLDRFTLPRLLQLAESEFGHRCWYLDRDGRIVYGESEIPELFDPGKESGKPKEILCARKSSGDLNECRIYERGNFRWYECQVSVRNYENGKLIVEGSNPESEDTATLALLISRAMETRLAESLALPMDYERDFEQLVMEIMDQKIWEEKDVIRRFRSLPFPVKNVIQCILIRFESDQLLDRLQLQLLYALRQAFAEENVAVYKDDILLLLSYDEGPPQTMKPEDRAKLEEVLERFSASAGVMDPFRRFGHFRTEFLLADRILRIGFAVRFRPKERIFTRGDYMHYLLIDMALRNFVAEFGHYNFAYVIHPAAVCLARKDAKDGTDYLTLLHVWLTNHQSAGKTAELMYMHRNTVLNRLKRIESMTGCHLGDAALQHQLLLSCCLMRYSRLYLHRDLLASDFIFRK